jgi:transcriptional regulator with XRE-family HTH domain
MFSSNIKFLRKRRKRSQDEVSLALGIKRSTWSTYELGVAQPGIDTLLKISDYFKLSLDTLLREDVSRIPESRLREMEIARETDVTGRRLRVIVTTVGSDNRENIELVPQKAKAGYTNGYADPEYIKILPTFRLPFLAKERKYRTFPISGDSMPPVGDGSWVTGEYVDDWTTLKNGNPYIIVTQNDGIVFKIVYNNINESESLLLCSTNPDYAPYHVKIHEVLEVWKFVNYISAELPEPNLTKKQMTNTLLNLQKEVGELKNTLNKKDRE